MPTGWQQRASLVSYPYCAAAVSADIQSDDLPTFRIGVVT
jgi:hypothetical protein